MNRPDPVTFAEGSYILAFASAFIMMLAFVLGLRAFDSVAMLRQIVWLALFTSGVGVFLSYAARQDFKRYSGPADAIRKARVGWRVNLAVLIFMLVIALVAIVKGLGIVSIFGR
jgi:archaellum biogenesis protein FlaJ (TadC family)